MIATSRTLVLASTSPYRRELLAKLQVNFEVAAPEVDETPLPDETPAAAALRLSALKAKAVADRFPNALIIGSDQVATLNGMHIGKPGTHDKAVAQLRLMRGQQIVFHTALSLYNSATGRLQSDIIPTTVQIRPLTDTQIEHYLRKDQPYNCAGSARSEALGIAIMEKMEGSDPNALIGLPLIALTQMLMHENWDVLL
ncbi:septum formation inhibitor Maf [Sulfuriferula sp. AH1]|uniref:Maf family nucleotide pyrophosphatase n=1 Tax=Sulfuriferula sp. AH1 TaxID=1985873 RepID=UPI000B3B8DE5|nr:Maf family nucleotide pyrophosphatase [Sulfuriferula sp. AH1]ARU31636.1 septum formation inhibitor Maf [Sulfuriferula sp. AH1]